MCPCCYNPISHIPYPIYLRFVLGDNSQLQKVSIPLTFNTWAYVIISELTDTLWYLATLLLKVRVDRKTSSWTCRTTPCPWSCCPLLIGFHFISFLLAGWAKGWWGGGPCDYCVRPRSKSFFFLFLGTFIQLGCLLGQRLVPWLGPRLDKKVWQMSHLLWPPSPSLSVTKNHLTHVICHTLFGFFLKGSLSLSVTLMWVNLVIRS